MAISGFNTYTTTGAIKKPNDGLAYIQGVSCKVFDTAKKGLPSVDTIDYWNYSKYAKPTDPEERTEGATLTEDTAVPESQFTQYTSLVSETYRVTSSGQQRSLNGGQVGTDDMMARKKREALEKLKMKRELSFIAGAGAAGNASSPTTRKSYGLIAIAASGVTASIAAADLAGTTGEAAFAAHLDAVKVAGGLTKKNKSIMLSHTNKGKVSAWKGIVDETTNAASEATVFNNVDVYASPYGKIAFDPFDLMPDTAIVTLNPDEIEMNPYTSTKTKLNAVGALFEEYAVFNEMNIRYRPVAEMGVVTIS